MKKEEPFEVFLTKAILLRQEFVREIAEQLPEKRKKDPRVFFKFAKMLIGANKRQRTVRAFTVENETISVEEGLI